MENDITQTQTQTIEDYGSIENNAASRCTLLEIQSFFFVVVAVVTIETRPDN